MRGKCHQCGGETVYAWVDTRNPADMPIFFCVYCVNGSMPCFQKQSDEYVTLDSVLGRGRHEDDSGCDLREPTR